MISKSLFLIFVAVGAKKAKQEECKDSFLECYKYKSSCNVAKFQKMCPQTCRICPEDLLSARGSDGLMCKDKYPAVCHHISKKQCKENDSIKQACRQSCNLCDKDIGIQLIYKGTPACEDKSWCKSLFNGACLALGKREERRKYGEYCPIECRKEECAFEWEGGLVEHKIETNNDCKDISKICNDLIDKVPSICSDESSVMTRFCQASCKKCDIVVADDDVEKLECKDYSDNCATKNLFDQKLGRANEECNLDPTVHHLKKEDLTPTQVRKLRYQGFCRKTCNLCDDIIFEKETKKEEIKIDPACGPTVTPDCKFLEKSGICTSEPMRCIYGCTLCKKPKDLLPLILPQTEIDEFRASLKKQRRPVPKPAPRKNECKDLQKTCPKWRCKNVKFQPIMAKHCKKTCGFC